MNIVYDINELIEISNKLQERIDAITNFNKEEAEFGTFMVKHNNHSITQLISVIDVAKFVLQDGAMALTGLMAMISHLHNWKSAIDNKITELKSQEFPNEIIL